MQNAPTEIAIGLREEYVQQHAHVFMEYNVEKRYPGFKDSLRRIGIRDDDGSLGQGKDRWNNQVVCTETIPVEAFEAVVVKKYDQNGEERLVKIIYFFNLLASTQSSILSINATTSPENSPIVISILNIPKKLRIIIIAMEITNKTIRI